VTAELTPYLAVRDARGAIDWYVEALGARLVGEPIVMPDGRIGHAALDLAGARLYLADPHPEIGVVAPDPAAHPVSLVLTVDDVDEAVDRAEGLGATIERPPSDEPFGRLGVLVDPYGHRWLLECPAPGELPPDDRPHPGDTLHLSLQVPDGARARDFYGAVLDWSLRERPGAASWEVDGVSPAVDIHGDRGEPPGAVPTYVVDDIEVTVAAVRTAGGRAGEIEQQRFGRSARCTDDQGLPFRIAELA
jgi:uncharacterized glyoxalase superfamily protein PhnB